jgi:hypothetical protein
MIAPDVYQAYRLAGKSQSRATFIDTPTDFMPTNSQRAARRAAAKRCQIA